jgi:hypothetical protein
MYLCKDWDFSLQKHKYMLAENKTTILPEDDCMWLYLPNYN